MDCSRRAFGKEAILERVAEGPPPLVPAPKVCRYLDKRFAKFQVPEDRNELLKYIEGMKGMTRGQSCWDPEAKLFDDRYLIVNICAELEPQDWAHMTRYFRARAAHVFRQLASEHGLQIRRQPELEFREPIHRGFYTYIAHELNRISAKMGSEERFTVEKARRRVYEEANNCSS